MVLLASVEGEEVLGPVLLVVERWMGGWGSGWWIVAAAATRTSSMPQLRHDPGPVAVDARTETFGA
jgi:type IV secretory pathway TrbD component